MVTLEEKVAFLSTATAYRGSTQTAEAVETHMAWVFLTDTEVFKLKKPVKHSFLDFSTLEKRRLVCEDELRLNRRLASRTYKKVQPLRLDGQGRLSLGNEGRVVEWLVVMKRLPSVEALDRRISAGRLETIDVKRLAVALSRFYVRKAARDVDGRAYLDHLEDEQAENRAFLRRPCFDLLSRAGEPLERLEKAWPLVKAEVGERVDRGVVVEGHGDLRPEHVFLVRPLQIIDCLEFNRAMRIIDPYDEVNYLGLESELLGGDWVRPLLLDLLKERLGDPPSAGLLSCYGVFRALLRARLCLMHLLESPVRHREIWQPLAIRYLDIARREGSRCDIA